MENLASGKRKTKKPHRCWHCDEIILPGTVVNYQANCDDGRAYTIYFHPECMTACNGCSRLNFDGCTGGECLRGKDSDQ